MPIRHLISSCSRNPRFDGLINQGMWDIYEMVCKHVIFQTYQYQNSWHTIPMTNFASIPIDAETWDALDSPPNFPRPRPGPWPPWTLRGCHPADTMAIMARMRRSIRGTVPSGPGPEAEGHPIIKSTGWSSHHITIKSQLIPIKSGWNHH